MCRFIRRLGFFIFMAAASFELAGATVIRKGTRYVPAEYADAICQDKAKRAEKACRDQLKPGDSSEKCYQIWLDTYWNCINVPNPRVIIVGPGVSS